MEKIINVKTTARDRKIDNFVINQANDEDAWELESQINQKTKPTSIRLSNRTINRAKFFAHVHHQRGYQSWLKNVIEDRINTEYELYKKLKKSTNTR
jgi:predicted DNA-binding protein